MNPQTTNIRTRDGHFLSLSLYLPPGGTPWQVLVVGPGAGVEQARYRPFAEYCAERGCAVLTFDYRGIGYSGNDRMKDFQATLRQWANQDLDAVLRHAHNAFPKQEIVFVGHCISGEIAGIAPAGEYIHRMVLVSSALSCWRLWPHRSQFLILLMKLLTPLIVWRYGFFPGKRLRYLNDMPRGVILELSNWCNRPNGLFDVFPDNNYRKMKIPLLAYSFTDDWFSPPKAVAALLGHFSNAQPRWQHLDPVEIGLKKVGHDGFFDPACATLWEQMLAWCGNLPLNDPMTK